MDLKYKQNNLYQNRVTNLIKILLVSVGVIRLSILLLVHSLSLYLSHIKFTKNFALTSALTQLLCNLVETNAHCSN